MLDQGSPLPIVSAFLGHSSPDITASVYSHQVRDANTDDRIRQALAAAGCDTSSTRVSVNECERNGSGQQQRPPRIPPETASDLLFLRSG